MKCLEKFSLSGRQKDGGSTKQLLSEANLVPRSQSSVRECRNVRSGKVRYNAISGWLPELRMPHSNLLCDWLFPSVFGFRSVRGRNKNTESFRSD